MENNMRWNQNLSHYLTSLLIKEWEKSGTAALKAPPPAIREAVHGILNQDLNKEAALEQEVQKMLDALEKTHTGQFERYKMYPLLKKKLAEKKGIIL